MKYKTPAALEMAVKAAAVASPLDTNRAIAGFYYHRLLCRVFSEHPSAFVLKGGMSMLARTVDARTTRDIDLVTSELDIETAINELRKYAAIDLGDFIAFRYESFERIKLEDNYRNGFKVTFTPLLGGKQMQAISVDLVADNVGCIGTELVHPVDRLPIKGLVEFDYVVYRAEEAITDKVFGIIEGHNGRPSSRVKDLVDLAVYLTTEVFDGSKLFESLRREMRIHKATINEFAVPDMWRREHGVTYSRLAGKTGLAQQWHDMAQTELLVKKCIDPVLAGTAAGKTWNPDALIWEASV